MCLGILMAGVARILQPIEQVTAVVWSRTHQRTHRTRVVSAVSACVGRARSPRVAATSV